jgi:hypothetical protein
MKKTKRRAKARRPKAVTGSVVPAKYRDQYKNGSCGDEFARLFRNHVLKDGVPDPVRLRKFADANDLWQPQYAQLNPGMQSMNVRNRGRAKFKRGEAINWGRS